MKLSKEKIILLTVIGISAATLLYGIQSPLALTYNAICFMFLAGSFWFISFFRTGDTENRLSTKQKWGYLSLLLLTGWAMISVSYVFYVQSLNDSEVLFKYFFYPSVAQKSLEIFIPGTLIGIVYGYIRRLILTGNRKRLKQIGYGTGSLITLAAVIFYGFYLKDVSYEGTDEIRFLDKDQQITSMSELLQRPELKGKTVYVDFWYSSCSPCIKAFRDMDEGKKILEEQDIVTLYMGRETSHENSKQRWINTIKEYELEGWHVYMSEELETDVYNKIGQYVAGTFGYPHYLLINEKGEITDWNAPGITETDKLKALISSAD